MLGGDRRIVHDAESLDRDVMSYRVEQSCLLDFAAALLALDWWIFYAPRDGAEPEARAAEIFAESVQTDEDAGVITPPPVPPARNRDESTPPPSPKGLIPRRSIHHDAVWLIHYNLRPV